MNAAADLNRKGCKISPPAETEDVAVLLAVHNGEAFLREQLDSLEAQSHRFWSLMVSDDASVDGSMGVLKDFLERYPFRRVETFHGPCAGPAGNFLSLLQAVEKRVPYAAFCDQDDVWMPDKLQHAIGLLAGIPAERPALYCGRTLITNDTLGEQRPSPRFARPPSFQNALVQSIAGGNTMVLNRAALDILQAAAPYASGVISHDWWAYQIISGVGGRILYDPQPRLKYRQHRNNLVGANDTLAASFSRLLRGLRGQYRTWNDANLTALFAIEDRLDPKARQVLNEFAEARRSNVFGRLRRLWRSGVYRQTRRGTLSLWIAACLGKI